MNRNTKVKAKRTINKTFAIGMASILGLTPVAATNVFAADDAADQVRKEETVYVNADATGKTNKVTVSDRLVNAASEKSVPDVSDLTDIENIKGDETFSGTTADMKWTTAGNDITYQGTSNKQLPVGVSFTYLLDGKEIAPADLAGKSGKLTIKINYTNNTSVQTKIGDKNETLQSPFVMMTGLILPTDTFSNIKVDNGKIVDNGNRSIVLGFGMPGLKESLDLAGMKEDVKEAAKDAKKDSSKVDSKLADIDIPDSVEITADVTNFSMDSTFTVALTDVFDDLDLDKIESTDDLQDAMDDLEEATVKLVDGSSELADGAKTLDEKYGEFNDGIATLKTGIDAAAIGINAYTDGVSQVNDGAAQLNTGLGKLKTGTDTLSETVNNFENNTYQINAIKTAASEQAAATVAAQIAVDANVQAAANAAGETAQKTATDTVNAQLKDIKKQASDTAAATIKEQAAAIGANAQATVGTTFTKEYLDKKGTDAATKAVGDLESSGMLETIKSTAKSTAENDAKNNEKVTGAAKTAAEVVVGNEETKNGIASFKQGVASVASVTQSNIDAGIATEAINAEVSTTLSDAEKNKIAASVNVDSVPVTLTKPDGIDDATWAVVEAQLNRQASEAAKTAVNDAVKSAAITAASNVAESKAATVKQAAVDSVTKALAITTPNQETVGVVAGKLDIANGQYPGFTVAANNMISTGVQAGTTGALQQAAGSVAEKVAGDTAKTVAGLTASSVATQTIPTVAAQTANATAQQVAQQVAPQVAASVAEQTAPSVAGQTAKTVAHDTVVTATKQSAVTIASQVAAQTSEGVAKQVMDQFKDPAKELKDGVDQLKGGANTLAAGTTTLNSNSPALKSGATQLSDGAVKLQTASGQVKDGIGQISDGATKLADGTKQYKEEGIDTLTDALDKALGKIDGVKDRLTALNSDAVMYRNYSGISDGMTGSVKFVISTEAIKAE